MISIPWWGWIVASLALALLEFVTPGGFVTIFFAVAAFCVGIAVSLTPIPDWAQWALFSALSIAGLFSFRKRLLDKFAPPVAVDSGDIAGGVAIAVEAVAPKGYGKAEFRGTSWSIRNVGEQGIASGQRCRIEKTDGLTLLVKAETD